jgi:hypothetical protein
MDPATDAWSRIIEAMTKPESGSGLRAPQGCGEWAVVILGVIWLVLAVIFVVALIVRLSA